MCVGAGEGFADGDAVEDGEVGYRFGVVHGQAEGYVAAPVMADDGESLLTELVHQGEHVGCEGSFRGLGVIRGRRRGGRPAVPA